MNIKQKGILWGEKHIHHNSIFLYMLVLKFKLYTSFKNVLLKIQTSGDKKNVTKDDIFIKSVWLNYDMHS